MTFPGSVRLAAYPRARTHEDGTPDLPTFDVEPAQPEGVT